ncbi:transcriptional regulator [Streptomyces armeniacus]|uniref:Transcriptional regulator n=1 Tax=Streptomyces armeniacus TaxID=83291 RepID=A0A345XIS9_9ACTN|nr:helix-turn-helix domain-containing protein [Streptomyces armeniacus]AXK31545.1 transcriptional regulator [Streptomyces armeniacus]
MRGDSFDPDCPTRLVLDRIGDKWSVLVVLALSERDHRFTELRDRIGGVTAKVLTQTLRAMARDGLLTRQVFAEVPPRVEYSLTPLGHSLVAPIMMISDWAEEHVSAVMEARDRHDGDGRDGHGQDGRTRDGRATAAAAGRG